MRIALAGISHETNTYCKDTTPVEAFYCFRASKLLATAGQESDTGGAVDACMRLDTEPVPILFASTQPSGLVERSAYEYFKDEILQGLEAAAAHGLDGCVLLLHGAGVVEDIPDLEADLVASVRALLPDLPITASFDLHGNLTRDMTRHLNGAFVCHEYPHIDMHQRAAEAVAHAIDMARSGRRGRCELINLPVLLPTTTTYEGIGRQCLQRLLELEERAGCIDLSWCHGFPFADVAHVGSTVLASFYPEQQDAAIQAAHTFAAELWACREQFRPRSLSAEAALEAAQARYVATNAGPVVINETSDNCGAGTPGDGTHLLRAMLDAGLGQEACFGFIVDPEVAAQASSAGIGSSIHVNLGGKTDTLHGAPLELSAYVKAIHDGRLIMRNMFKGARLNLGPTVRLVVDGMDIVVASRRSQTFDQEPFLAVGIDVMKYRYVALKSSNHFRAGFEHLAQAIVTADPPGLSTNRIDEFPRTRASRPLWPLDERARFEPAAG
ncbi:MAG: M81 family metallopeptidase [Pseudomonadota bacterium]